MPRKVFAVNEILTAADVNDLLMDQTVMSFAGTAERGTAIASPSEGMVSYLEDSGHLEIYGGTATGWVSARTSALGSAVAGDSLVYDGTQWLNGPRSGNAIINGDFGVWQRGTSFSSPSNTYSSDRWEFVSSGDTVDLSREDFTPADIEAVGYGDAEYYLRLDCTTRTNVVRIEQPVEDVRTFAGQQVTFSAYLRSTGAENMRFVLEQNFGSGGSATVALTNGVTVSSSWARYSWTVDLASMSGKTIGSGSFLQARIDAQGSATTYDIWGVQLEAGPVATPFKLAGGGSKAAELALCQRYYWRVDSADGPFETFFPGQATTTTNAQAFAQHPVPMRTKPSVSSPDVTKLSMSTNSFASRELSAIGVQSQRQNELATLIQVTTAVSGLASGNATFMLANDNTEAVVEFDAEL